MVVMSNEMTGLEALSLDFTAQVRERYERWLPERLAEIPESERDSFYSTLAEEIAERVQSLELALRGPDPEDEPFMKRLGRFNMARLQAIEMALAELLPAPDYEAEFRRRKCFKVTDEGIAAVHGLDPEDPDYEPSWSPGASTTGRRGPTCRTCSPFRARRPGGPGAFRRGGPGAGQPGRRRDPARPGGRGQAGDARRAGGLSPLVRLGRRPGGLRRG